MKMRKIRKYNAILKLINVGNIRKCGKYHTF